MTAFCLVELDRVAGGPATIADASLRALTLSRDLAIPHGPSAPESAPAPSTAAATVAAVLFGDVTEVPVTELGAYGVTDIYLVRSECYAPLAWARALSTLVADPGRDARAVIAAGTDHGNEVLAHLAAITGLPLAAQCVSATAGPDGRLDLVRQRWAGLLLEEAVLDAPVALLTVATDAVAPAPAAEPSAVTVHAVAPAPDDGARTTRTIIDELERVSRLHEKGLLTAEEFAQMKTRLIGEQ